jgi:transposase
LTWRSPDKFGKGSGEVVRITGHAVRWRLLTELADSDYRIRGLVTRVDQPQNLISYHLRLLRDSFARHLRRDQAAVHAGLTLSHNSGPVEGTVNKIKMLKRQMFGRAGFDLLRTRVLHAH